MTTMAAALVTLLLALVATSLLSSHGVSAAAPVTVKGGNCGTLGANCCAGHKCTDGHSQCLSTSGDPRGVCAQSAGVFVHTPATAKTAAICEAGNAYMGDSCSCPAGFSEVCAPWTAAAGGAAQLCVCAAADGHSNFGGLYAQDSKGTCVAKNRFAGDACRCPAGTTAGSPLISEAASVFLCFAAGGGARAAGLAGVSETEGAKCVAENPFSKACKCPAGSCAWPALGRATGNALVQADACAVAPAPAASVAVGLKTAAISRLFEQGIKGEIALNQQLHLPDESGHDYSVSGIVFSSLKFTGVSAKITGTDAIAITMSGGSMIGSIGRIRVKKSFIHATCNANPFDLGAVTIQFTLSGANLQFPGGRMGVNPATRATAIAASVGAINVDIHGNWICKLFKGTIEGKIKDAVRSAFSTEVPGMLAATVAEYANIAAQNISSYDTNVQIDIPALLRGESALPRSASSDGATDTSVFADMSVQGCAAHIVPNSVLELGVKGSAFTAAPANAAFLPPPFKPDLVDLTAASKAGFGTKDAVVCLTATPFDSLAWAAHASNEVKYLVTPADVPAASPLKLNTSNLFVAQIAPGMGKDYPNDAVDIMMSYSADSASTAADFSFGVAAGNTIGMTVGLDLQWLVRTAKPGNNSKHCEEVKSGVYSCKAFNTRLDVAGNMSFTLTQPNGKGNISAAAKMTGLSLNWTVISSNVGVVQLAVLKSLDSLVIPQVTSAINGFLANHTISVDPAVGELSLVNVADPKMVKTSAGSMELCFGADATLTIGGNEKQKKQPKMIV